MTNQQIYFKNDKVLLYMTSTSYQIDKVGEGGREDTYIQTYDLSQRLVPILFFFSLLVQVSLFTTPRPLVIN